MFSSGRTSLDRRGRSAKRNFPNDRYPTGQSHTPAPGPGRSAPVDADRPKPQFQLHLGLLGHFQGIVHLDAEVADRALQLRMREKHLHGPQVLARAASPAPTRRS